LRVYLGLLRRQLAASNQLGDERMVVGQLVEPPVAKQVGARVADVAEGHAAVAAEERGGDRRAHAGSSRIPGRAVVHAPVRLRDPLRDARLAAAVGAALPERCRGEPGGDLAGLRAAHPVGDGEERRLADEGVFVAAPLPAGVGAAERLDDRDHDSYLRSVSPIRTTSPGASRRSRVTRMPFTYVPFVEPMSSSHTPSRLISKRAWRPEAYSSAAGVRWLFGPRPTVSGFESSA